MTDATTDELDALAKRLTAAQRKCVLAMTGNGQRPKDIPAAGTTLHSLWDFGRDLNTYEGATAPPVMIVMREVAEYPLGYEWDLTRLGLALRAHMEAKP